MIGTPTWPGRSRPTSRNRVRSGACSSRYSSPRRTYTLRDLYNLLVGFRFCTVRLFDEFLAYDARRLGTRFEIPFFLFQGESDVVTLTTLAQDYFAEVEAPVKSLAIIPDAGHFAAFTRPERFLTELVTRVRPLASAPSASSTRKP